MAVFQILQIDILFWMTNDGKQASIIINLKNFQIPNTKKWSDCLTARLKQQIWAET